MTKDVNRINCVCLIFSSGECTIELYISHPKRKEEKKGDDKTIKLVLRHGGWEIKKWWAKVLHAPQVRSSHISFTENISPASQTSPRACQSKKLLRNSHAWSLSLHLFVYIYKRKNCRSYQEKKSASQVVAPTSLSMIAQHLLGNRSYLFFFHAYLLLCPLLLFRPPSVCLSWFWGLKLACVRSSVNSD